MRRQYAPQMRATDIGSFGAPQVRVIVIGGGTHRYGLRTLFARILREELGDDGPMPSETSERSFTPPSNPPARSIGGGDIPLSAREREVLEMLARGLRNKEIAEQLFISPSTVNYHLTAIFNKLTVANRTEAVGVALQRGLITLDTNKSLTDHAA